MRSRNLTRVRKPNETNLNPLAPLALPGPPQRESLWKMDHHIVVNARRAQRLTLTVPSSNGQRDDLMNHTFQGARRCPYDFFFVCVCLSQCVSVSEP